MRVTWYLPETTACFTNSAEFPKNLNGNYMLNFHKFHIDSEVLRYHFCLLKSFLLVFTIMSKNVMHEKNQHLKLKIYFMDNEQN